MPFCQACGNSVNPEARFCGACGSPANIAVSASPSVATASAAAALPIETLQIPAGIGASRTPASVAPEVRMGEKAIGARRPRGVTILAVLSFLAIIPTVSLGLWAFSYGATASTAGAIPLMQLFMQLFPVLAQGQQEMVTQSFEAAFAMFAIAAVCAVMSYGLWMMKKWGRIVAIVSSVLLSLHAAVMILTSSGTFVWHVFAIAINIWIFTYLLKPHVKQAFGA
jgi:hypothetical protein